MLYKYGKGKQPTIVVKQIKTDKIGVSAQRLTIGLTPKPGNIMKKVLLFTLLMMTGIVGQSDAQKNELIIIGNVHIPMPNYNADTLYRILEQLAPDIILHEMDSDNFTMDNKFKDSSTENEQTATSQYITKHPATKIGPFEFEGRNNYRRIKGIKQSEIPTMKLLDSLFAAKLLNEEQSDIVTTYRNLTDTLNTFGYQRAYAFNNSRTDSISRIRQWYQHHKVRQVIGQRKEFKQQFVTTTTGETITLCEGYNRFCDFWDVRNQTMAKNIMDVMDKNPGKKIVVLTGYYHRYYLIQELDKIKSKKAFQRKEFYE